MTTISNAEAALLGLLAEGEKHPYQIEKDVEYRDMRFWTDLSMSTIYKTMNRLEKEGLLKSRTEIDERNVAQRLYTLTRTGRTALKKKVKELASMPAQAKWPADIGFYNMDALTRDEAAAAVKSYAEGCSKIIEGYRALEKFLRDENCPLHRVQISIRPRMLYEAERSWALSYVKQLEALPGKEVWS
jgi:DNA-binding PadR family transcriptional regulator